MARRKITQKMWDTAVAEYTKFPGAHASVARVVGVDARTCKKLWTTGNSIFAGGKTIEMIVQGEQLLAKARLAEAAEVKRRAEAAERTKVAEQAKAALVQEAQIVTLARTSSLTSLAAVTKLAATAKKMADYAADHWNKLLDAARKREELGEPHPAGKCDGCGRNFDDLSAGGLMHQVDRMTSLAGRAIAFAHQAMQMERLHQGKPGELVGIVTEDKVTPEEAAERSAIVAQAVERARARKAALLEQAAAEQRKAQN